MQQIVSGTPPKVTFLPLQMAYETIRVHEVDFLESAHKPPFDMIYFQLEVGDATPKDRHEETEIWIILSGSGRLVYDGQETSLEAGDSVHFVQHRYHQVFNEGQVPLLICSLSWK